MRIAFFPPPRSIARRGFTMRLWSLCCLFRANRPRLAVPSTVGRMAMRASTSPLSRATTRMRKSRRKKKVCPNCKCLFTGYRRAHLIYRMIDDQITRLQCCSSVCVADFNHKRDSLKQLASTEL